MAASSRFRRTTSRLRFVIFGEDSALEGKMVVYALHRNSLMGVVPMVLMRCTVSWRRNVTRRRDGILIVWRFGNYRGIFLFLLFLGIN